MQFYSEAVLDFIASSLEQLEGFRKVVELDESCFSHRKYNCSRLCATTSQFGGDEQEAGRTFLAIVCHRLLL
jgi:hypothetical protein